ncbi:hypothetical protein ACFVUS_24165 [Nocardia sp. NPDC058058]|uniref:hypothetical protein n=1 Tax=Nocardia sp. NPDC058058 TaxID=3346317 RepID=UPI0036D808FE
MFAPMLFRACRRPREGKSMLETPVTLQAIGDGVRGLFRRARRMWAAVPLLAGLCMASIPISDVDPLWLWGPVYFAMGFGMGVFFRRINTSHRFGIWELQVDFYAAQDNRRLPVHAYPPFWQRLILAEQLRMQTQRRYAWVPIMFGVASVLLLVAHVSISGFRLLPTGVLVVYSAVCAGYVLWHRLMTPWLVMDLDELARQIRFREFGTT